jgi:hypothetical protein
MLLSLSHVKDLYGFNGEYDIILWIKLMENYVLFLSLREGSERYRNLLILFKWI